MDMSNPSASEARAMRVEDLLKAKGRDVETIRPDCHGCNRSPPAHDAGHRALVVSTDGTRVEGMITERDVVHAANRHGSRNVRDGGGAGHDARWGRVALPATASGMSWPS